MFNNKEVAIFDFDGTLVDSSSIWKEAHYQTILQCGGKIEECQKDIMWKTLNDILHNPKNTANPYGILVSETIKTYELEVSSEEYLKKIIPIGENGYSNFVYLKPSVLELIKQLKMKNYKIALATNSYRKNVDDFLNSTKYKDINLIKYFDLILTHEDVVKKKPDPEIYLKVLEKLNVNSTKCIVFEDSISGVRAAQNISKLDVCAVYDVESRENIEIIKSMADYYINDFSEAIEQLNKLKYEQEIKNKFIPLSKLIKGNIKDSSVIKR